MRQANIALALLLLIQAGVLALQYWPSPDAPAATPLWGEAGPQPDQVFEIHIGDRFDNEVVLRRRGDRWLLPELGDLPADGEMVATLLAGLMPDGAGWPVARTAAARQRFQVADYHFRRRVILIGQEELLGTIYLGTSPGFRKVHARREGRDEVHGLSFNHFEAPARGGAWLDRGLLQTRVPVRVTADLYELRREDGRWRSGTGGTPESRELEALLDALQHIQVDGIANPGAQRELADLEADVRLQIEALGGDQVLELFSMEGRYYLHSSRYPLFFRLAHSEYQRLAGLDSELLMGVSIPSIPAVDEQP